MQLTAGWSLLLSTHLPNPPLSTDLLQTRDRQDLLDSTDGCISTAGFHCQITESQQFAGAEPEGFLCYCKQVFGQANPALLLHWASPPCFAKKSAKLRYEAAMLAGPFLLHAWPPVGVAPFSHICWETACSFWLSSVSYFSGAFLPLCTAGSAPMPAQTCPRPLLTIAPLRWGAAFSCSTPNTS